MNLFITVLQFISTVWEHKGDVKGHFSNYPERILLTATNQTEERKTNTQWCLPDDILLLLACEIRGGRN